MKKILLFCSLLLCVSYCSIAQDVKYQYAQLIGERKAFSGKLTIHLDLGERYKPNEEEQRLVDELENYSSTVDALNRLTQANWEPVLVVNALSGTAAGSMVVHTLRKKK